MGERGTCLGTPFGFSGTALKLFPSRTRRVACPDGIGWIAVGSDP